MANNRQEDSTRRIKLERAGKLDDFYKKSLNEYEEAKPKPGSNGMKTMEVVVPGRYCPGCTDYYIRKVFCPKCHRLLVRSRFYEAVPKNDEKETDGRYGARGSHAASRFELLPYSQQREILIDCNRVRFNGMSGRRRGSSAEAADIRYHGSMWLHGEW